MSKYIDADRLKAEIKGFRNIARERVDDEDTYFLGMAQGYDNSISIIESLQQEQPKVQNGKFVFPKYLYARTKDNKTIDMSYAPQDMTAVEYIRNDFVEQEQPEPPTCKSCDFYENDCPFIRDKFIPYPNRVCKDYTSSVMKEQERPIGEEYAIEIGKETHTLRVGSRSDINRLIAQEKQEDTK